MGSLDDVDNSQDSAGSLAPIGGVSLETYAAIIRELGARGSEHGLLRSIAASHGVNAADWELARAGWGARIKDDGAIGSRFNSLYTSS